MSDAPHDAPLFPSDNGDFCSKEGVVSTIREAVLLTGKLARDAHGDWMYSGHTFRITGARMLAQMGMDAITYSSWVAGDRMPCCLT